MLRKLLEFLGLIETSKVQDVFIRTSSCEPFDSLALIQALSGRRDLKDT